MNLSQLRRKLPLTLVLLVGLVSQMHVYALADSTNAKLQEIRGRAVPMLDVNLDSARILIDEMLHISEMEAPGSPPHAYVLNILGEAFNRMGKPDSALMVFQEALLIYEELGDTNRAIGNRLWMAMAYQHMEDFDAAIEQYNSSLVECSQIKDSLKIAIIFENLGSLYSDLGDFPEALRCTQNALSMYELLKDSVYIGTSLGDLGSLYAQMGDEENEIEYRYQSLEILQTQGDSVRLGLAYLSLCETVMLTDSLEKGFQLLHKAESTLERTGYLFGMVGVYASYCFYYMDIQEDLKLARSYCDKALSLARELGAQEQAVEACLRLGTISLSEDDPVAAIGYGKEGLELTQEFGLSVFEKDVEELLAEAYQARGRPAKAIFHLNNFMKLQDSLYGESQKVEFARVEMQHAFDQQSLQDSLRYLNRQRSIELASAVTLEAEKREKLIAWFVVLLVAMATVFIFRAYRSNKGQRETLAEKNEALKLAVEEKAMLLKEVHHRVKNNFQIVSNLLELQSRGIQDEKAKELAREGQNRVRSMALIHQRLYQNDELQVQFSEYLEKLVEEIQNLFGKEQDMNTQIDSGGFSFDIDTAIPLGLIVNELVTNAFKYGFDKDSGGNLGISLVADGLNGYQLRVRDSGSGLPHGFDWEKTRSLGLRLVRRLAKQLMGEVNYSFENGAVFVVSFKDAIARAEVD